MRAGDHVKHLPTGEEWVVAYVDGDDLAWCGWPDGLARVSDCVLTFEVNDAGHRKWLEEIAASKSGRRARHAQAELDRLRSQS